MAASDSDVPYEMFSIDVSVAHQPLLRSREEGFKMLKHRPWTLEETMILLRTIREVESQGKSAREINSSDGINPPEEKWDYISFRCREKGIHVGSFQCQKRYAYLQICYRKVKKWEMSHEEMGESFFSMGACSRRDEDLPGWFDIEVFKFFEQKNFSDAENNLGRVTSYELGTNEDGAYGEKEEDDEEDEDYDEEDEDDDDEDDDDDDDGFEADVDEEIRSDLSVDFAEEDVDRRKGKEKVNSDGILQPDPLSGNKRQRVGSQSPEGAKSSKRSANNFWDDDISNPMLEAMESNNNLLTRLTEEMNAVKEMQEQLTTILTKINSDLEKHKSEK